MKQYILQNAIAFDQQLNTLLGGYADETLSARAWRTEQDNKFFGKLFRPTIDVLALIVTIGHDTDHCYKSYVSEQKRKQLPKEYQ